MKNRLRKLRKENSLTLAELSEMLFKLSDLRISPDLLSKYERGERNPKKSVLVTLSEIFKVPPLYLNGTKDVHSLIKDGAISKMKSQNLNIGISEDKGGYSYEKINEYLEDCIDNNPLIDYIFSNESDYKSLNDKVNQAIYVVSEYVLLRVETCDFSVSGMLTYLYLELDHAGGKLVDDNLNLTQKQKDNMAQVVPEFKKIRENAIHSLLKLAKDKNFEFEEENAVSLDFFKKIDSSK
ncbi:helix-turn-helix domain-containing protein [Lactiplantibacillus plantarum]|uniref:helix-turn-helix domain-containing protein n=1 Tax=Lactiplantibacillus plantarum TaxID=1590 RepID=UPI003D814F87